MADTTGIARRVHRRRVLRAGTLLALCLGFGAVVSVVVAWWCVCVFERSWRAKGKFLFSEVMAGPAVPGSVSPTRTDRLPLQWSVEMPSGLPNPDHASGGEYGWVYRTDEGGTLDPSGGEYTQVSVTRMEAGWPIRCLWGAERAINSSRRELRKQGVPLHMLELPNWANSLSAGASLPTGIHPSAFIVDTLVYAAIPFALWLVLVPLRSWRRRRAGRCAGCGYDRAGLADAAVCPECGLASAA